MSARRAMAGSLVALLMPASLLMVTTTTSADAADAPINTTNARKAKTRVTLVAMPQIVQQGKAPASPDLAKAAITATIKPAKAGRPVVLQVEQAGAWKKAGKAKTTSKGLAQFAAPISSGGVALNYRVKAKKFKGDTAVTSKTASTEKWLTPTFTDEFSGTALAPEWTHRGDTYEPSSLRACSKGDPSAVKVSGGTVKLSVIKDPARKDKCNAKKDGKSTGKFAYRLNGHIGTEGKVALRYGFAAARLKTQKLRGQHGGFWMRPTGGGTDPAAEIDVIEYFGDKHPQGGLTSFIYSSRGGKAVKTGSWIKNPKSFLANRRDGWSKSYHVFSVEWTPSTYIFRIDGKETWRTKVGVSDQAHFPILSVLASDYEISQMPGGDKKLPQTMTVDWVRMWQA